MNWTYSSPSKMNNKIFATNIPTWYLSGNLIPMQSHTISITNSNLTSQCLELKVAKHRRLKSWQRACVPPFALPSFLHSNRPPNSCFLQWTLCEALEGKMLRHSIGSWDKQWQVLKKIIDSSLSTLSRTFVNRSNFTNFSIKTSAHLLCHPSRGTMMTFIPLSRFIV